MNGYNTKSVNLKLSVSQEQTVVLASLKKHCSNLERELMQHALGNDLFRRLIYRITSNSLILQCM